MAEEMTGEFRPSAEARAMRLVSVFVSPADSGSAAGGGSYPEGAPVTVVATADAGFEFTEWVDLGTGGRVSTEASYGFVVGGADVSLQANFLGGEAASCGNCLYGREAPLSAEIGTGQLSCCRVAPVLGGVLPHPPALPVAWKFPIVRADWWCGEHEAR